MKVLPDNILKCMSASDRKALGQSTAEETLAKAEAKNERDLQRQIAQLLGLKDIEYCWHRMDKKSHATIGWPDFTMAIRTKQGFACALAWEVKFGDGELSGEQELLKYKLQTIPNGWNYQIIRSYDEAVFELKRLGL